MRLIITAALVLALASPAAAVEVVAAGDIASSSSGDARTSAQVLAIDPAAVLTLGDNAYPSGTLSQFQSYYDPTWGRFRNITNPAPGNHDYYTANAQGYRDYFGQSPSIHAYSIGDWLVVQMDSNRDVSAQAAELASILATDGSRCELLYWHHPRFSSGDHGSSMLTAPWWQVAFAGGVDVILNGHDHDYERFRKMHPDGSWGRLGIREFVVGTGGVGTRPFGNVVAGSVKRLTGSSNIGVLDLELSATSYAWTFRAATGGVGTVRDTGSASCHA